MGILNTVFLKPGDFAPNSKIILLASTVLSGIIASANTANNSVQAITSKDSLLNIDAL